MTLAEQLALPPGWVATMFPGTIEMELKNPSGFGVAAKASLPIPHNIMNREQWIESAAKAIEEATRQAQNFSQAKHPL